MSHVAESYVYRNEETGKGYVGRDVIGAATLIARPGTVLSDDEVAALGLEDLRDHTDYDAVYARAVAKGALVTKPELVEETRGTGKNKRTVTRQRVTMVPAEEVYG